MNSNNTSVYNGNSSDAINCWLNIFKEFDNCSQFISNQILNNARIKKFQKGEYLIKEGEIGNGIFFIIGGILKTSKKGLRNEEFILRIARKGDLIGVNSLFEEEAYTYSVQAIEEVTAYFTDNKVIKTVINNEPKVFSQLTKNICQKLFLIEKRITSIARKKLREQCAEMIISVATENNNTFSVNHSIDDLASLIGTSKSYLYKVLLEFTNKNLLSVRNHVLFITNMNALSTIATGNEKSN